MKDQDVPRQPKEGTLDGKKRYEREKAEDEQRYRRYIETGECLSHEDMMAWFDRLLHEAEVKL